jgi:serine/threonine protein kinase
VRKNNLTIGKYVIESELGSGAMGTVYLGYDPKLDRRAAIKVMKTGMEDETLRSRFFLEGRSAAKLDHPNIIRIWDLDTDSKNCPYIAMEYIEGEDLKTLIEDKRFVSFEQKISIIVDVCKGLQHAHDNGIIHRDVKPGNIRINRNTEPKILDFGLARLESAQSTRTRGLPIGSPYYMSPEQWRGQGNLDGRSDLFSTAAVLYELIAYVRPFEAEEISAVMMRIVSTPHVPLQDILPGCAPELSEIVDRGLAKDPNERFTSCREFARALEKFLSQLKFHQGELRNRVERTEGELQACKRKLVSAEIAELLGSNIPDIEPSTHASSGAQLSQDQTLDYGVLLQRHASLQGKLDALTESLRATLPLLRLFRTGHQQLKDGQIKECEQTVRELLQLSPNNAAARRLSAACRRVSGEYQQREEYQVRLRTVLSEARQAIQSGQFPQALQIIGRVLEIEPSHPEALQLCDMIRQLQADATQKKRRIISD